MIQKQLVQNSDGQNLNVLVEGPQEAGRNVLFVHGNGVDMHGDYFDDIVPRLHKAGFRTIRFDLRGCGKSEGKQEEGDYATYADDIRSVLAWARREFTGEFNIIAQSMGGSIVAKVSPDNIAKTVFTSIPVTDPELRIEGTKKRMLAAGGIWDPDGISSYITSRGVERRTGSRFWAELRKFDAIKAFTAFSQKTKLLLIRPIQDQIVPEEGIKEYETIPTLKFIRLAGNHQFSNPSDRAGLIKKVMEFLK